MRAGEIVGVAKIVHYGSEAQKERWLRPLVAGKIRTVFSMTEPDDGAGADPSLLKTAARADGDDFVIDGRKWLITGVPGAALNIVMARTFDAGGHDIGASMFLVEAGLPFASIRTERYGGSPAAELAETVVAPEV